MTSGPLNLPRAAWVRVAWQALAITVVGVVVSVVAAHAALGMFGEGLSGAGLAITIGLPVVIGLPLSLLHLVRVAQLRLANQRLQVLASTDWLTSCLNRRAFTTLVNGQLQTSGAFLVIDADHFKAINDRYGHDRGDEVLQLIAASISSSVRDTDIVGRIGGEEFGVFLHGVDEAGALLIAERIRDAVQRIAYAPDGETIEVSVSVGGACFSGAISFSELFRIADQRLYDVKQSGRNRTDLANAAIPAGPPRSAAA